MNRILFDSAEIGPDGRAVFGGVRAQHVLGVLHGTPGQILKTGVLDGAIGTSVIEAVETEPEPRVTVKCTHDRESAAPWIDLLLAPPRPRALKRLLPQLATLGAGTITLVGAEKVEKDFWGAQLLKETVYRPLLVEGLQQAGTSILPRIVVRRRFREYLARSFETDFPTRNRIVAHPYAAEGTDAAKSAAEGRPLLAIGPEGGWTDEEVALLEARGFRRYSLGSRILRTDTATIALLARLMEA